METNTLVDGIIKIGGDARIESAQDFLDVLGVAQGHTYVFDRSHFSERFFTLSTGVAGEILQKASTYRKKVGIVGDFSNVQSKPLRDFIFESNRGGQVAFAESVQEAIRLLS